ncbi:M16 family metallopeptidase [Shewanella mangrovisoli]|uniref:M16 family metallopeptidase n=1 Tax=Shewanella mangrovisoli TaxID=2864211 RepID=UPI0035B7296F
MIKTIPFSRLAIAPKLLKGLKAMSLGLIGITLMACQQTQLNFTATQAPSLASFDTPTQLPEVGLIHLPTESAFIDVVPDGLTLPYQLHRVQSSQGLSNRVSLVAISPNKPFENPDILQFALQEKALSLALNQPDACLETFETRVTLHSINLSLACPMPVNHLYRLLIQFWQADAFSEHAVAAVDIDNIRRQLKLNKHLNAFSGAEIDKVWRDKLLGATHPYNQTINNQALYDSLTLSELSQLQQRTFAQAKWHLFLESTEAEEAEFDLKQSLALWPSNTDLSLPTASTKAKPLNRATSSIKQSHTIYLIDAPGSVQTQVRIGYALDDKHLSTQDIPLACRSLAAILGRSFSGRLYYDLREQRGLTYGIYGQCANAPLATSIKFYGSTAIEHTGAFVVGILAHLNLLASAPASEGEIAALKTYLIGEALLTQDNPSQRETQFIHQLVLGLDPLSNQAMNAKLQDLTPAQLQQLTQQAFSGEPLVILRGDVDRITADLTHKLPGWQLEVVKVND